MTGWREPEGQNLAELPVACIESGKDCVLLDEGAIPPEFFDLSSGAAGRLLHELGKYHIRLAAVVPRPGDHSGAFQDFVRESNRGSRVRFFSDREAAEAWLDPERRVPVKESAGGMDGNWLTAHARWTEIDRQLHASRIRLWGLRWVGGPALLLALGYLAYFAIDRDVGLTSGLVGGVVGLGVALWTAIRGYGDLREETEELEVERRALAAGRLEP